MTSYGGLFRLKFSDENGHPLAVIRSDGSTGKVHGALFHTSWSGRIQNAPGDMREWLALRNLLDAHSMIWPARSVRKKKGEQVFLFTFRGIIPYAVESL